MRRPGLEKKGTTMLAEALNTFVELVRKSQDCEIVQVQGEARHLYGLLNRQTGKVSWHAKVPQARYHQLYTLSDFVAAVKAFRHPLEMEDADEPTPDILEQERAALPSVFCGRGFVRAVLDEPHPRREGAYMMLARSPEFSFLDPNLGFGGSDGEAIYHPREHAAFINMLRIDLGQAVDPADLLVFRNVKVLTQAERESKQQSGRQALSTEVMRAISSGGKDVPEEITLSLFAYGDLVEPAEDLRQEVRVAVIVDLQVGTFTMRPICGELERAQRKTDAWVRDYLETELGDEARVFNGAV